MSYSCAWPPPHQMGPPPRGCVATAFELMDCPARARDSGSRTTVFKRIAHPCWGNLESPVARRRAKRSAPSGVDSAIAHHVHELREGRMAARLAHRMNSFVLTATI